MRRCNYVSSSRVHLFLQTISIIELKHGGRTMRYLVVTAIICAVVFSINSYACYQDVSGSCGNAALNCASMCEPGTNCNHDDAWDSTRGVDSVGGYTTGKTSHSPLPDLGLCGKEYHCVKKSPQTSCGSNMYRCANGQSFASGLMVFYTSTGSACP